ncbi:NADH-quinone oxidoreductase subunit C [Sphingomonas lutea]|uniref:NADH-quinone oxidoreductase subunit C n=1 Tax=Sphingomonas lutea TaxID=1045317 RepID=A0A7G9SFZ9_9SPHN|nr:NADH-quinone oxidoreductase subunit C [Sphingomonas lutea]QNN66774.1 NADH-quinone oxidoreductase subunit C [Sphingomonas lutea]
MASSAPRYAEAPAALGKLANATARAGIETAFDVARDNLVEVLRTLRDEHEYQQLMEIAGVDYPDRPERFEVVYCLLSLTKNHRVRVHVATDENTPVPSVTGLWPVAGWLEREVFDMYGVGFSGNPDLRRILTDYGFEGYPQRKDFPLTGHVELRYSEAEKRVVYEPVSLPQDFRNFDFLMPWEGPEYHLPGDEKAAPQQPGAPTPAPAPTGTAPVNPATPAKTPKVTESSAQTGAGEPTNAEGNRQARKSSKAKAESEVSKPAARKPAAKRKPKA